MTELLQKLQQAAAALAFASEPEAAEMLLLAEMQELCRADLALLYSPLFPKHWRMICCYPKSALQTTSPPEINWSEENSTSLPQTALAKVLQSGQGLRCDDPLRTGDYNFRHLCQVEVELERELSSVILVPLQGPAGQPAQVVELLRFSNKEETGFSADELSAASILSLQAASGLLRIRCRQELSELFESLIQLIGSAIDEKSPFAGDHCRRVPVLAMMLAKAVTQSESGPFRSIRFSDAELYELEVAAWLHDIGKLITPIHITDKATKLERTFDRFDLVRTRFEILRRDLEIGLLRSGKHPSGIVLTDNALDAQQMLEDLRFLADCNRGRSSLTEEETRRVREIAQSYRWVDRQGEEMPVLTDDEAENLMVVRGTLTDAEREMVNQHVVSTINMLDMLPFPRELARVPEIAGSHHESFNGRGFPTGLRGEQMLLQTRILALADRFESVSAGSRPYKTRNSLNQALLILREMVDNGEVDPDLFKLFITGKLYEAYAIEFLSRDQIDPVDPGVLLSGL